MLSGHALPTALRAHQVSTAGGPNATRTADRDPAPSPLPPTPTRRWSEASKWPSGKLPQADERVVIGAGEVVLLDISPPPLGGLQIDGALVFDRADLELRSDHVLVHGGLYVGSATEPFTHRATITITGDERGSSDCYGSAYLGLMDGVLELYGDPTGDSWTRLAGTAAAGDTSIVVDDAYGWLTGDRIVIASTDFYNGDGNKSDGFDRGVEERTVTSVNGNRLGLNEPLAYSHYGEAQSFGAHTGYPNTLLESRAEVARLSRNVTVRGLPATADESSDVYRFGAHIMAMGQSRLRLDSVELTQMGQAGVLMRYPVHFHLMGNAGYGSFIRNSSMHHLYNRCISIHGTNGVLVDANAAYNTFGHCYFLEDGAETGNVLTGNLGLMARKSAPEFRLLPTDGGGLGPSIFWITNPDNVIEDNVAASSQGSGFWYSLPEHPTGPSYQIFDGANMWPRRTPLGSFKGNLAHSNANDGLHVDRGPAALTLAAETTSYRPRSNPADPRSAPVQAVFEQFSAYKHRAAAAWFRGDNTVLRGALLVDNAVGVTFASRTSGLEQSVVVGESANFGTAEPWEKTGEGGRPLPKYWKPDFAIRGFEFYDGPVFVTDSYFANFEPNSQRQAAAISFLDYTAFSISPLSYAEGLTFAAGTNRVRLETRASVRDPRESDSNEDGYRSAVFLDRDGSVSGSAGRYVTVNNPLLTTADCSLRADWNAYVCSGRYASLTLRNMDSSPRQLAPLELQRGNSPTAKHIMYGSPHGGPSVPNVHFRTMLPLGHDYVYTFAGAAPHRFTIELGQVEAGEHLLVSLPYSGEQPYIYRDWWIDKRSLLSPYSSLSALRGADDTGYYLDRGAQRLYLLLRVQVAGEGQEQRDYAHLSVCAKAGC